MNILILNGSPRANGNTAAMVKAFEEGAIAEGHRTCVVNVGKLHIGGCKACEYCHTRGGGRCFQDDGMNEILEAVDDAEVLVIASPVYYFTLSAQMQAALQRFYPILKPRGIRKAVLLLSSMSPNVYDSCIAQFNSTMKYWGVRKTSVITAYGEENKSEAKLQEIRELAEDL